MGRSIQVTPAPVHNSNGKETAQDSGREPTKTSVSCLRRIKVSIVGSLENSFERLGLSIGQCPERYIAGCLIVCSLCSLGLLVFEEVSDPDRLWVPRDAQVLKDQDWVLENFPSATMREQILAEADNILTPTGLSALLDIYSHSVAVSTSSGITLSDVCLKAGSVCVVYSILEIWSYNSTIITSLSQEEIISGVNSVTTSPVYGNTIDVTKYLGTPTTNSSGSIISAQAAVMTWFTLDQEARESWEDQFIALGLAGHSDITTTYVLARKSFREEARRAAYNDAVLLVGGHFIVIVFVIAVLGNFNLMEQKVWLTLAGFISIGLAEMVAISLGSALGQGYGPIQSVLPFLLLGLGVDDMFVIVQSLNSLTPKQQEVDIPHKMAAVLRHAGVSITVTSLTDLAGFLVGSTTIIPALRSFCIYAAFGVTTLYILQATLFTSFLTLDLRRNQRERDACLFCCVSHPSPPYSPSKWSTKQFVPFVFKQGLAKVITKWPFKVTVLIISVCLVSGHLYGLIQLEQFFDRNWLLTDDSYAKSFIKAMDRHFPEEGLSAYVFCGNVDYWGQKSEFETLASSMDSSSVIYDGSTDSWFSALTSWLSTTSDPDVLALLDADKYPVNKDAFMNLTYRMTIEVAPRTSAYIVFDSTSGLDIKASLFPFRHVQLHNPDSEIEAMDSTRHLVQAAGFSSSECFPYSTAYLAYETNKVIQRELYRNIGLALVCVFLVTLILVANVLTSLLVFTTVVCTLVNVAGTMHYWGLTIDIVTSVILIVSVGLSVDYSAHIGHVFMTLHGTRQERIRETIVAMGPAVFYGGFSTFLAFSLLSVSDTYVFQTFFEVNFLVVLYGLFNGLVLLPVLLSWFGPEPHSKPADNGQSTERNESVKTEPTAVIGGALANRNVAVGHSAHINHNQPRDNSVNQGKPPLAVISLEEHPIQPSPSSLANYTPPAQRSTACTMVQVQS